MSVNLEDVKIKSKEFDHDAWLKSLPPGAREDHLHGGKTASPLSDLAMFGLTFAAVKNPLLALTIAGAPTNTQELSQELTQLKQNPLKIGKLANAYRARALKRAYNLGKKVPGVSGVIDKTEGIIPRLRGIKQLVTQGKVTDVGPGISTSVQKSKRPGALGKGNPALQQRLKNAIVESHDAEQLKQLGIKSADELEIGTKVGKGKFNQDAEGVYNITNSQKNALKAELVKEVKANNWSKTGIKHHAIVDGEKRFLRWNGPKGGDKNQLKHWSLSKVSAQAKSAAERLSLIHI